jgi:hypothetical protein
MDETNASQAPATTESVPEATTPQADTTPNWQRELDTVDPKELRKHPKIAGIVGNLFDDAKRNWESTRAAEERQKGVEKRNKELLERAESDPIGFAEEWLNERRSALAAEDVAKMRGETMNEYARRIGRAYHDVPEWAEATQEEREALVARLAGVSDEDAIAKTNAYTLDIVAEKRAKRMLSEWKDKELAKEREAIRKEERASKFKDSDSPDLSRPGAAGKVDIRNMAPEAFKAYWDAMKQGKT